MIKHYISDKFITSNQNAERISNFVQIVSYIMHFESMFRAQPVGPVLTTRIADVDFLYSQQLQ